MAKLNLRIPTYDQGEINLMEVVVDYAVANDPLLSHFPNRVSKHSGLNFVFENHIAINQIMERITFKFSYSFETIKDFNLGQYTETLTNYAEEVRSDRVKRCIAAIQNVSDNANSTKKDSTAVGFDAILEMLESYPLTFDANGKPNLFTVFANSKTAEIFQKPLSPE